MARNTSAAYVQQLKGNRKYCIRAIITYADETSETLTELKDFMKIKVEDSCSGTSEFEIGAAIINEAVITLNNRTGKFNGKSFFGATIKLHCGIYVDGVPELMKMGTFLVNEPVAPGSTINIVAFDNMIKADKRYVPRIIFPATNAQIAEDACSQCGIILKSIDFPNSDYLVSNAPEDSYTCREILSYIAQMAGCFVRCDANGEAEIRWYDSEITHEITELQSKDICTDSVTITGIDVLLGSETVASSGAEGYKLAIKDNALIQAGDEQIVADYLAEKLIGFSFRPLSVKCRSDASIEAGDKVNVIDEKGNSYETLITSTTFTMMSAQKIECNAASPVINSTKRLSETAKAIIASKKYTQVLVEKEISDRKKALEEMSKRIIESSGLYMTTEKQEDGSVVYYGHDKVKLEDSMIIWKFGLEAIGISTDGGKTYPYGFDISGTTTLNRIYAVGINADYINSGTLTAKDKNGNIVFSVNVDSGEVIINSNSVKMYSGKTLTEEFKSMGEAINNIDGIFFFIRYSANADGSNMTANPQSDTMYMGTCSTNVNSAPTDPKEYVWSKIVGKDGVAGREIVIEYALSNSSTIPPESQAIRKLGTPVICLEGMSKLSTPEIYLSTGASTTAVLGYAVLGQMILGDDSGAAEEASVSLLAASAEQLDAPVISIVSMDSIWSTTVPVRGKDQYIWQRIKYIYPDGGFIIDAPVCITGDKGDNGVGVKEVKEYYAVSASDSEKPSEWSVSIPELTATNKYLWNYEVITYTDNSVTETAAGIIGVFGDDGKGIEGIYEYYALSKYNNEVPSTWSGKIPTLTNIYKYLWNYEEIVFSDGTKKTTDPCVIGVYGDTGTNGRDAISFRIESSLGMVFLDTQNESTVLTARVYKGAVELDVDGAYGYTWYLVEKDGTEKVLGNEKTITVLSTTIAGKSVYFVVDDGGVSEEMVQLDTPVIELVEEYVQLEAPVIYIEASLKLETPVIGLKEE